MNYQNCKDENSRQELDITSNNEFQSNLHLGATFRAKQFDSNSDSENQIKKLNITLGNMSQSISPDHDQSLNDLKDETSDYIIQNYNDTKSLSVSQKSLAQSINGSSQTIQLKDKEETPIIEVNSHQKENDSQKQIQSQRTIYKCDGANNRFWKQIHGHQSQRDSKKNIFGKTLRQTDEIYNIEHHNSSEKVKEKINNEWLNVLFKMILVNNFIKKLKLLVQHNYNHNLSEEQVHLINDVSYFYNVKLSQNMFRRLWTKLTIASWFFTWPTLMPAFSITQRIVKQKQEKKKTWLQVFDLHEEKIYIKYVNALYYSLITMSTVGYGDISPTTTKEKTFVIAMTIVSCGIFAYAINTIGSIFNDIATRIDEYKKQKYELLSFMDNRNISQDLQRKVIKQLEHQHKMRITGESKSDEVLNILPENLNNEIRQSFYGQILHKTQLFNLNFSKPFLDILSTKMKELTFAPGQQVFVQDFQTERLFFVYKGEVELYIINKSDQWSNNDEKHIVSLGSITGGQILSYKSFFSGQNEGASARSTKISQLIYIDKRDLLSVLKDYPKDYERFCALKDTINLYNQNYGEICKSCNAPGCTTQVCPYIHFYCHKSLLTKKYWSLAQVRREKQRSSNRNHAYTSIKSVRLELRELRKNVILNLYEIQNDFQSYDQFYEQYYCGSQINEDKEYFEMMPEIFSREKDKFEERAQQLYLNPYFSPLKDDVETENQFYVLPLHSVQENTGDMHIDIEDTPIEQEKFLFNSGFRAASGFNQIGNFNSQLYIRDQSENNNYENYCEYLSNNDDNQNLRKHSESTEKERGISVQFNVDVIEDPIQQPNITTPSNQIPKFHSDLSPSLVNNNSRKNSQINNNQNNQKNVYNNNNNNIASNLKCVRTTSNGGAARNTQIHHSFIKQQQQSHLQQLQQFKVQLDRKCEEIFSPTTYTITGDGEARMMKKNTQSYIKMGQEEGVRFQPYHLAGAGGESKAIRSQLNNNFNGYQSNLYPLVPQQNTNQTNDNTNPTQSREIYANKQPYHRGTRKRNTQKTGTSHTVLIVQMEPFIKMDEFDIMHSYQRYFQYNNVEDVLKKYACYQKKIVSNNSVGRKLLGSTKLLQNQYGCRKSNFNQTPLNRFSTQTQKRKSFNIKFEVSRDDKSEE